MSRTIPSANETSSGPQSSPRATAIARRAAIGSLVAALGIAVASSICFVSTAEAQPAFAIGKPLPDNNVPTGTVIVRVIAGSTSTPEVGVDAILVVGGTPRQARTDSSGRATFGGLPAGATVIAKVVDADKKEISSDEFQVPAQGGARVMLSTKPMSTMAAPAGPANPMAAQGMPQARQISGQPRPDGGEPPGIYSVRVTYNNLQAGPSGMMDSAPPVGTVVHLVGYGADDSITVQSKPVDTTGVAKFEGLDQSGGTSYFAMTSLNRGPAEAPAPSSPGPAPTPAPATPTQAPLPPESRPAPVAIIDRMVSVTVVLDGQAGVRVVLSGEKRDSKDPAVDDYGKLVPRDGRVTEPGKVRITLDGVAQIGQEVTLFDIATKQPLGTVKTVEGPPDPTQIRGGANFTTKPDVPAGTVDVVVLGGQGTTTDPLPNVAIQLIVPEEAQTPIIGASGVTGRDGKLRVAVPAGFKLPAQGVVAMVTINGKDMFSSPMDLSASGGLLELSAQWPTTGRPEAILSVPDKDLVVYAETKMSGQTFRSLPFEVIPGAGMHANIYIYPRTLFSFDTHAFVEDQLLAVQGTFEITNYAWAPYRASADGLLIKLPAHYKGAVIAPQDQAEVAVATGDGFRIMRPIPPGGRKFRAGFSMPIEDGSVDWKFDLPLGTLNSAMRIRQTPGMTVKLPKNITGSTQMATTGEPWFIIENIRIERKESFVMTIAGFPADPAWKTWVPRFAGIAVLFIVFGGLGFALVMRSRDPVTADAIAKREKLMTELVELEKRGMESSKDRQRREQLIDELERTWGS